MGRVVQNKGKKHAMQVTFPVAKMEEHIDFDTKKRVFDEENVDTIGKNIHTTKKLRLLRFLVPSLYRAVINTTRYSPFYGEFARGDHYFVVQDLLPGTTALDIGASVGETAIYMATWPEVSEVLAYEPFPRVFAEAAKNVKLASINPIYKKIRLFNAAVANEDGFVELPDLGAYDESHGLQDAIGFGARRSAGVKVRAFSFSGILKRLRSQRRKAVLKMDIEGGEKTLFNGPLDFSMVYRVMVEYHCRSNAEIKHIEDRLRDGRFNVSTERIAKDQKFGVYLGNIYAWK